ncbi:hypothetical protein [Brevundimonas sp.]|jgi:hypothetical protein|uniref:hypothetical protein n=1 Tax=Brevundimonas sp. TaxID=1871086 RepID=UPI0037BEF951
MSLDLIDAARRLQRLDDPPDCPSDLRGVLASAGGVDLRSSEAWADAIDALVSRALRFAPTSPDIAAALLDLIADGLDRDDQPRADRADLKALEAVAHYVRRLGG